MVNLRVLISFWVCSNVPKGFTSRSGLCIRASPISAKTATMSHEAVYEIVPAAIAYQPRLRWFLRAIWKPQ